ncbi:MAG: RIP metalloprotease RseP, partial [Candidatus Acidiferrum sp.]
LPDTKAAAANPLKPGDLVLSIDGTPTRDWEQALLALSQIPPGAKLTMQVEDAGKRQTVEFTGKDYSDYAQVLGYAPIRPTIDQVAPGSPADLAGLREGDTVTAVNGNKIEYWDQFREAAQSSKGQPMTLDVDRKGQTVRIVVTPKKGAADADDNTYQIGVLRADVTAYKKVSFSEGVRFAGLKTYDTISQTLDVVGKLFSGRVSIKQLQGPVGISHMAGQAVKRGPLDVISLMVLISINLGILNLLPIPILDGGNILLLAIEGIMRRDLSLSFKERFVQVGLVFLLVIFAIVMYNDILRRITSHS